MSATNLTSLRVDIAGSFLRPARLKELFGRQQQGTGDAVELQECLDSSVREVIRQQECRGLPVVTDGEFRRVNFQDSFAASVKGFPLLARTFVGSPTASAASASRDSLPPGAMRVVVTERLELAENLPLREYQLASAMANVPVKVTVVGIERLLSRFDEPSADAIYPSRVAFAEALITVQREIIGQLIEAGCRYIQIDEPGYTGYVDLPTLDWLREQGRDPTEQLQAAIDGDNRIIAGWPAEVTFGVHVCRGNARSKWHREGAYDGIAERLFGNLAHHRLLLEYD
ncbi:MAG: hypothetical protein JOZ39_00320, partial [Chloroflexi bacterium]|nr:hypothetical protein [Chloroflexota bacterium]